MSEFCCRKKVITSDANLAITLFLRWKIDYIFDSVERKMCNRNKKQKKAFVNKYKCNFDANLNKIYLNGSPYLLRSLSHSAAKCLAWNILLLFFFVLCFMWFAISFCIVLLQFYSKEIKWSDLYIKSEHANKILKMKKINSSNHNCSAYKCI